MSYYVKGFCVFPSHSAVQKILKMVYLLFLNTLSTIKSLLIDRETAKWIKVRPFTDKNILDDSY